MKLVSWPSDSLYKKSSSIAKLLELAPWMVLLAVFYVHQMAKWGWLYPASDDSYIYLGYVKMAITAPFELFSYNLGEHSAGLTGILYYYLLLVVCSVVRLATLYVPLSLSLILGMFILNGILFLAFAAVLIACWKHLSDTYAHSPGTSLILLFALVCANKKFLWGFFAGMENPLTALLCILLFYLLICRAPFWQAVLVAAALSATRPELTVVTVTFPALAVLVHHTRLGCSNQQTPRSGSRTIRNLGLAYALWAGALFLLVLPCYLLTDRFFPSALGSRVLIPAMSNPAEIGGNLLTWLQKGNLFSSDWLVWGTVLLICSLCLGPYKRVGWISGAAAFILGYFVIRAALGMTGLNVEDRYVSYLWGLYALGLAVCVEGLWAKMLTWKVPYFHRWGRFGLPCLLMAFVVVVPLPRFVRTFTLDVQEMNEVVVEPSRWMAENLPEQSRICMEPAGAIRLFTDLYLIDTIGLTTTHFHEHDGNYCSFLKENRIDYVFDYPKRNPVLRDQTMFENIKTFTPTCRRHSYGMIGVYRVLRTDEQQQDQLRPKQP